MRGPAADCLLGLRVRIPPGHRCLCCVCCTLRSKRQKPGQSGLRSTDRVQTENKEKCIFTSCRFHCVILRSFVVVLLLSDTVKHEC
jgi:hypothetical protein